ncbi:DUF6314 family protein [Cognatiyoonia sp. IB215446]|uniref:DUF6314 family protein n=1 Tax=Cognatiyoonia sp. IB215446 TaxID=3097355 RepID=UPI002A123042|nr:DUF6314 family protein [Cognatiyoonia sp. IB215446]MDX8349626.1 DUF6314 family protein [Cognatiyoonia sp. IB215446]
MLGAVDFIGQWQVQRVIDDRYGRQQGVFEGICVFSENGASRLDYAEEGRIRMGAGPALTANRRYLWAFGSERVDVFFTDGGAFHSFVPARQADGTDHPCGDDYYRVQYDFRHWPDWQATWHVMGPRKDYTSTSHYSREAR